MKPSIQYLMAVFAISITSIAYSQQQLLVLDPGIKKANQFYQSLSFIHKTAGANGFFVALTEENNVHFYLYDKNWKNLSAFKENREWVTDQSVYQDFKRYMAKSNVFFSPEFRLIGSISPGEKEFVIIFLRNNKLYFEKVDFTLAKSTNLDLWEPGNKGKILHTFTFNNKIYWIVYNKKNDDIIDLYRYDAGGKIDTKSFSIRQLRTVDAITRPGSSSIGSDFIDNDRQTDLLKASARIKFYAQDNSLFVVSDEIRGKTKMISVELDSFAENTFSVDHQTIGDCRLISSQNSFLLNDHLLQVNVCEGTFTFTIHNLLTRKHESHSFNKDQQIEFKNSDVVQYWGEGSILTPEEKKLNKTAQFIRKVDGVGLSLTAILFDSTIEVTMGSSQLIKTGGGSMYTPGGSISTPGGTVSLPGSWVSSGFYSSYTRTIFFKSLFNTTDLKHVNSSLPGDDKMKAIDEFYDSKTNRAVNAILDGKDVVAGYLEKDTKKFIIIRF